MNDASNDRSYVFVFWQKRLFVVNLSQGSSCMDLVKFHGESSVEEDAFWTDQKEFWKKFRKRESLLSSDTLSISFLAKTKTVFSKIERDCHWTYNIDAEDIEKSLLQIVTDSSIILKFLIEKKVQKFAIEKVGCDKVEEFFIEGFLKEYLTKQIKEISEKDIPLTVENNESTDDSKGIGFEYFEAKMKANASNRTRFKNSSVVLKKK
mgnify:FL=1